MAMEEKEAERRSNLSNIRDPIDLELTEVARGKMGYYGKNGNRVDETSDESDMFCYGEVDGNSHSHDDEFGRGPGDEVMSLSDRFNLESVIDILANVDEQAIEERMVTQQEDDTFKTIAGIAGNVLEWYDFAVFGYFSDILGSVFFPPDQEGHAAIVESFVVFGGAFFVRPVGGVLMGYIGDKYGSRKALTISIFLMAFPTFAMGCLPGYDSVGSLSIVLLTLVRLFQGLSVGGQMMSSLVFTLERHPTSKWGIYGSYVMAAANAGTLMGGLVATIIRRCLTDEALHTWGWRVPFLSGILVSASGFYLKKHDEDDASGHVHGDPSNADENPVRLAFSRSNMRSLLASSMVPLLWSSGFYLSFVWMAIYMEKLIDVPVPNSFAVNSASLGLSMCILFPVAGWLSDKLGRRRVMAIGGLLLGSSYPILLKLIGTGHPAFAFSAQSFLGLSLSLWGAPMMAWLVESFEPSARLTSVSIGYNIAQAFGGGIAPAIATEMVDQLGSDSPGFYITAIAFISLVGLCCVSPRKPAHFTELQQGEEDLRRSGQSDFSETSDENHLI